MGVIWQYAYTNTYNVKHHADFFSRGSWKDHRNPLWHTDVLYEFSYFSPA